MDGYMMSPAKSQQQQHSQAAAALRQQPPPSLLRVLTESHRGRGQYPDAVWESHKDEIRRLYLDEQRTLKDTVEIMAKRGFRATAKMYKARFARWKWTKYDMAGSKMAHAKGMRGMSRDLAHRTRRRTPPDSSEVCVTSSPVPTTRLKGVSQGDEVVDLEQLVHHFNSHNSPTTQNLRIPQDLRDQENAIRRLELLLGAHLGRVDGFAYCGQSPIPGDDDPVLRATFLDIPYGIAAIQEGHKEGYKLVWRAFRNYHRVFQDGTNLQTIARWLILVEFADENMARQVWRYLAAYSGMVLRGKHPLHNFLLNMSRLSHTTWTPPGGQATTCMGRPNDEARRRFLGPVERTDGNADYLDTKHQIFFDAISSVTLFKPHATTTPTVKTSDYDWLLPLLNGLSHLYGVDEAMAYKLANSLITKVPDLAVNYAPIYWACRLTQAMYCFRVWSEAPDADPTNPRAHFSIFWLSEYIKHQCALGSASRDHCMVAFSMLVRWKKAVGNEDGAEATGLEMREVLDRVAAIPELN